MGLFPGGGQQCLRIVSAIAACQETGADLGPNLGGSSHHRLIGRIRKAPSYLIDFHRKQEDDLTRLDEKLRVPRLFRKVNNVRILWT
jgi:hypothetical protein